MTKGCVKVVCKLSVGMLTRGVRVNSCLRKNVVSTMDGLGWAH